MSVRPDCLQPIVEQPAASAEHQDSRLHEEQFESQSLFSVELSTTCERGEACKFAHACYYCHSSHKGKDCKGSTRSKKGRFGDSLGEL